jgi:hypothetical protein
MVQQELDLDNDGKKEVLLVTSWSGVYYNKVYLFETNANNSFEMVWAYSFYQRSNDYSTVAVSDLDGDGRKEILCLVDPVDSTVAGLYAFEWNGSDNGFPSQPTATWNFGLPGGFDEGTAIIASDFDLDGRDEIAVALVERWSPLRSRIMIFSLANGSTLESPTWVIEMEDTITFAAAGYALSTTDLDQDGRKELVVVGWEYLHVAVYEHTGTQNSYACVADVSWIRPEIDLSNMGLVEANFDNDSINELYIATGNGNVLVMTNPGDVGLITISNFHLLHQYDWRYGLAGMTRGDVDSDGVPELYIAGSYHEAVFQWKYAGGPVASGTSYLKSVAFQDDTTDDHTTGSDQGWLRPSKVALGDFDRDGRPDMVIASASFAGDKPVLMMVEQTVTNVHDALDIPQTIALYQNYPNPFNPTTAILFELPANTNQTYRVMIKIYNSLGQDVATLVDEEMGAGSRRIMWDASGYPSGAYFYALSVNGKTTTRTAILTR